LGSTLKARPPYANIEKNIPREKIYSSYPAVMIGRLGISLDFQSKHQTSV
jgi:hypothetical protein